MGADLIVYIMKGPAKVTKVKRAAALRAVDAFLAAGADLLSAYDTVKLYETRGKGWEEVLQEDLKRCEQVVEDLTNSRDSVLSDYCEDRGDDAQRIVGALKEMSSFFSPEEFVDEFIAWWENGGGRDTSGRPDPDDQKKRIQVCGDMSWGDSPEGYGYTLTSKAYWFHVPQALGIL
jgi:hypothetical protein